MLSSYPLTLPNPVISLTVAGLPAASASLPLLDSLASALLGLTAEIAVATPWYAAASVDPEEEEEEQDEDDEDEYEEDEYEEDDEDQEDGDDDAYDDEEDGDEGDDEEAEEDAAADE